MEQAAPASKRQRRGTYHQYSRHVTGALTPERLDFYRKYPLYAERRFPSCSPSWFRVVDSGFDGPINIFGWLEQYIINSRPFCAPSYNSTMSLIWDTIAESLKIQIAQLTQGLSHSDSTQLDQTIESLRTDADLTAAGMLKAHIIHVHNEIEAASCRGLPSFFIPSIPKIEFLGDLIVLHPFPGTPLILTYQMLVNVLDKIEARFSWSFYLAYIKNNPRHQRYDVPGLFHSIYNILEDAYNTHGNKAIRLCKLMEPIAVGVTLLQYPAESNDHDFLREVRLGLETKYPELLAGFDAISLRLTNFLGTHGVSGVPYVLEQMGQGKLHNYPIVKIEEGLKKMYTYGTAYRTIAPGAAQQVAINFKREFFVAYFESETELLKTYRHANVDPEIRALINKGSPGSIRECFKIPDQAWAQFNFLKNFEFDYFPQISDLLDDKAISPHTVLTCTNFLQ